MKAYNLSAVGPDNLSATGPEMHGFNQTDASKAWIVTYTGLLFYHLAPTPEMISIKDIAHSLSQTCRWTGHSKFHYSVAQHSFYCSYLVTSDLALAALMHDSAEAYIGDMNRPLKHYTPAGASYMKVEEMIERVIFKKFGLSYPLPEEVKIADTQMLYTERDQIMNLGTHVYEPRKWGYDETRADIQIVKWTPRHAEKMFLSRFESLNKEQSNANRR